MKRFNRKSSAGKSVRRIALREIDEALAAVGDAEFSRETAIHSVRQSIKRLRALLKLVRTHFDGYSSEDIALRDAGRLIAGQRDADVLRASYDRLVDIAGLFPDPALRDRLVAGLAPRDGDQPVEQRLAVVAGNLISLRARVRRWRFKASGFRLVARGLSGVYEDMRDAERLARRHPTAANFHEWRKQVKYHTAQLSFLREAAPDILGAYGAVGSKLGDVLGEHHDLDVLLAALAGDPAAGSEHVRVLAGAVRIRMSELQDQAFRLGDELGAERPAAFRDRIRRNWRAWRA